MWTLLEGALRACLIALGVWTLARLVRPGHDSVPWLLDVGAGRGGAVAALVLIGLACSTRRGWRALGRGALGLWALVDGVRVLVLEGRGGDFELGAPPLSLGLALLFGAAAIAAWRLGTRPRGRRVHGATLLALLLLPFALMATFGRTDYRRPADLIAVLGAGVRSDGTPSRALADRVETAIGLWRQGLASRICFSGGRAAGRPSETAVMRRMALAAGVPEEVLILDPDGVNTHATGAFVADWARTHDARRILAVSHGYHLPRVKFVLERAGLQAATVPARGPRPLARLPWYWAREAAAIGWYWARPLLPAI